MTSTPDATSADDATVDDADALDASFDAGPAVCTETQSAMCDRLCPAGYHDCTRDTDSGATVTCMELLTCGRRFAGLRKVATKRASPLGALFAQSAYLEEASVTSFEVLASELRAHGAPPRLVTSALRSAREETRHARTMTSFANRHGANVARPKAPRRNTRTLARIARENAIEGCVRETYGALVATYQATHATDANVRSAMKRIARDETRHAVLAWEIDAWASAALDARGRRALERAKSRAVKTLARELQAQPHPSLVRDAGIPTAREATALLARLVGQLGL
jgi:hypothetical protein